MNERNASVFWHARRVMEDRQMPVVYYDLAAELIRSAAADVVWSPWSSLLLMQLVCAMIESRRQFYYNIVMSILISINSRMRNFLRFFIHRYIDE